MKEDIIAALITVVIVIGIIIGFGWLVHSSSVKSCLTLGEMAGYATEYRSGACWIELCDDTWVKKYDLPYYLDICN